MSLRPFLGRTRELADLDEALARAVAGDGNVFLVSGEPGIGKTRLAEQLAERAGQRGAAVFWARAWEVEGAPACWPWIQVLRACVPGSADALAPAAAADPEIELLRRGSAIVEVLRRSASERPIVLVFDDLHAADLASLALLERVVHELRGLRVLVVGTYRPIEARRTPQIAALLARIARAGSARPLGRLDEAAVAAWIEDALGAAPSPALIAAVFASTEGNPLFLEAVVQLLATRGQGTELAPGFALPDGIHAAVQELVSRVSAAARRVLECVAVLGRQCAVSALELLVPGPPGDVLSAVEEAIAAGIVEARPRPSSPVRFVHVLVREAIYQALPAARRIELHAGAGRALARLYAAELDGHLAELAHHAFEGAPAGSWADAADFLARAGQRALDLGAFDDAVSCLERALLALGRAGCDDCDRRIELLFRLGEAQIRIGRARAGRDSCERAAVLAEQAGRPDLHARAALGFGLEPVPGRMDARLIELLESALRRGPDSPSLRARVIARLAAAVMPALPERALALAREAIAAARELGDRRVLAQVLVTARAAFTPAQPLDELQALDRELVALAGSFGDLRLAVQAHGRLALVAIARGDADEVELQLGIHEQLADQLRLPQQQMRAAALRLVWATATGDDEVIAGSERRILELADRLDDARGVIALEANRCMRAELAGDLGAAAAALDRIERRVAGEPVWNGPWRPIWRASIQAQQGRLDDARAELQRLPPELGGAPFAAIGPALLCRVARIATLVDDRERMRGVYERLLPYAPQISLSGAVAICEGPVAYHLGRLAAGLGQGAEAAAHLRDALARAERAGFPAYAELARQSLAALGNRAVARAPARPEPPPRLERDGCVWVLIHDGRQLRLQDSKGVVYLAVLLGEPGREFHVGDLIGRGGDGAAMSDAESRAGGLTVGGLGDAGELLDARARAAYRKRLDHLRDALEDAEARGDRAGVGRIRAEREALADELARAVGLGGRARRAGAAAERARINVQRRIRAALTRIAEVDEPLGRYLDRRVKTGSFCAFEP